MLYRLAIALLLLMAPVALAETPEFAKEISTEDYYQAWAETIEDHQVARDPSAQPYTYYADKFGAYYYDENFNHIYAAAAFSTDSWTAVGNEKGTGGGGGPSVGCWQFTFQQNGFYFPNPNGSPGDTKTRMNLLVLGDDFNFYNATLNTKVYNVLGQLVSNKNIGSFSPNPNFTATVWDGRTSSGSPVASGWYSIKVTATSSICGSKSFSAQVIVAN